ncbi:hypothetical protein NB311A_21106 [Nitrobacter sp. Nb-311A]|nr:hypothetical protein NB311A_21106 [Nitrobacter sp. Nb-311A]
MLVIAGVFYTFVIQRFESKV